MACIAPPELDDTVLLAYVDGEADPQAFQDGGAHVVHSFPSVCGQCSIMCTGLMLLFNGEQ